MLSKDRRKTVLKLEFYKIQSGNWDKNKDMFMQAMDSDGLSLMPTFWKYINNAKKESQKGKAIESQEWNNGRVQWKNNP